MCVGSNLCCAIAVYFLAYFLTCIVGQLVVASWMWVMRWLVLKEENRPKQKFADWMGLFFVGGTERAVALTLVLWAPAYLPAFIGGWVVLKFALGWQRQQIQPKSI
jgi:hypothetical protein